MTRLLILLLAAGPFLFSKDTVSPPRGTKTPYTPGDSTDIPAPPGYAPYFINYVGRHGARHVTNLKELTILDRFLRGAAAAGNLTAEGDTLQVRVARLLAVEKQYTPGDLTGTGRNEQYGIGRRMKAHYPSLFSEPNSGLSIAYTEEARTRQSEESFMQAFLPSGVPGAARLHVNPSDSVRLRFFDIAPRYKTFAKKGPWTAALNRLLQEPAYLDQLNTLAHRWFTPAFAQKLWTDQRIDTGKGGKTGIDGIQSLAEAVYGAAAITGGLSEEIGAAGYTQGAVDIFGLLSGQETQWLGLIGGVKDFLVKGPGTDPYGIQVRDAAPLLVDLLQTTDSSLRNNAGGANLRFAHAETIAPLAALLELEGATTPDTSLLHYADVWKVEQIIPFSANVQWIIYRETAAGDGKTPVPGPAGPPALIKVLFNEKPMHLPVATTTFPYYRWQDVRGFYEAKLSRLGIKPGSDMYTYLLELK
jgi:multiple inositol-polyphosphate phosphatase/2,3-bisphosphoglycerate 3-phosphatase